MKFFVKIMFCLFMVIGGLAIGTCNASANPYFDEFYRIMQGHGFEINHEFIPRFIYPFEDGSPEIVNETLYREESYSAWVKDKHLYDITIVDALIEHETNSQNKCYLYKVACKPYQPGRNWGFLGIGSYGDDFSMDHVQVRIQFPNRYFMYNWAPKNAYNEKGILSVALNDGTTVASVNVDYSHPGFTLYCNAYPSGGDYFQDYYQYNYKDYYDYACQETVCYGMVLFERTGAVNINVDYEIVFHSLNGYEQDQTTFTLRAITHFAL